MLVHRSVQSQGDHAQDHWIDYMGHWISVHHVRLLPDTIGFSAIDEGNSRGSPTRSSRYTYDELYVSRIFSV